MMDVMASQRALHQLFAATFVGMAVDDEGTVLDIHDDAAKVFGMERVDMVGKPITNLFYSASHAFLKRYIKDGSETAMETLAVRKDGVRFLVEIKHRRARSSTLPKLTAELRPQRVLR